MRTRLNRPEMVLTCVLAVVLVAGCAQQQQRARHEPTPAVVQAPPVQPLAGYGPSYTTFEENGVKWIRGSMAFPTGLKETSGLLVEKTVPAEVLVGQKFDYAYKASNLTEYPIQMVTVADRISPNFNPAESDPPPTKMENGVATWQIGTLGPKETKTIHVKGSSAEEGAVSTCGWASYSPFLCGDIKVVKANIQLIKTAPAEVVMCDTIPMTLTVKNTGSSGLTAVKVTDVLPDGLNSDGKSQVAFDAGNLAPGESKEFKFNAIAVKTGQFQTKSQATAAQGVQAEAGSSTVVREPVLALACAAPDKHYTGRAFNVSFTVNNTGDTPAAGTVLEVPVPSGLTVKSVSHGGQASAGKVSWDLGALGVQGAQTVTATFGGDASGSYQFSASAKGACAKLVSSGCQTSLSGLAAILLEKADDPDPVGIGEQTTYTVRVTNQGSADDNNVKIVVTIAPELAPVSATGEGAINGQKVTFPVVPRLAAKEAVTYKIVAKGVKPGDGRTRFELNSDMLQSPVIAEESTHTY